MGIGAAADGNVAVRNYVEGDGPKGWLYAEKLQELYVWFDRLNERFFEGKLPQALICVDHIRPTALAQYRLAQNGAGLPYEITLNADYLDRPVWSQVESLCHEMVHQHQEENGKTSCKGGYHNKEFVALCEERGLHPKLGPGYHLKPADGPFAELMAEYGVESPDAPKAEGEGEEEKPQDWRSGGKRRKGKSSLHKWVCGCPAPNNSIRSGRRELRITCEECGEEFHIEGEDD